MEDSIYASIPQIENTKEFLDAISKKYTKFSKNEKNELSNNHWLNVCFESNVIDGPSNNWSLNRGATVHACNCKTRENLNFTQKWAKNSKL